MSRRCWHNRSSPAASKRGFQTQDYRAITGGDPQGDPNTQSLNRETLLVALALEGGGVVVALFHPRPVLTERQEYLRGKYPGTVQTSFAVSHMIQAAGKLTMKDSGRFMLYDGTTVPW